MFSGVDASARDLETIEVEAKLVEITREFPPNDLYDYAWVMKYEVTKGAIENKTIYVAHFNPRQRRHKVRNEMKKWVAGSLRRFKAGDRHRMKLTPHMDKIWKNAIEDDYATVDRKATRYWCLEVEKAD